MNLAQFDTVESANEGAKMEVRDTKGAPILKKDKTPVTITLLGADSDVARAARNVATNRYLKAGRKAVVTAESADADALTFLVKCTVGWDGVGVDEEETAFSPEAARKLYMTFPFVREQVDIFIADRENFLKVSQAI